MAPNQRVIFSGLVISPNREKTRPYESWSESPGHGRRSKSADARRSQQRTDSNPQSAMRETDLTIGQQQVPAQFQQYQQQQQQQQQRQAYPGAGIGPGPALRVPLNQVKTVDKFKTLIRILENKTGIFCQAIVLFFVFFILNIPLEYQ